LVKGKTLCLYFRAKSSPDETFETNVFGPLSGLDAVLPLLLSSESKTAKSIVVTGSKQGITNPPGSNPAYNASKAAVKSLTEHLAHDLRSDPSTAHISAHLLIPGWTWTGMMGNVGPTTESDVNKPAGAWYPSQVADELWSGLEKGSFYIICPDGETDRALDQARMKWGNADVYEERPALSRWEESWKGRADQAIQADAKARRG
jgi:NAD(P)-dependent dehydrogenase (short-subunit alcohol dehydrogenase family)